MLDLLLIAYLCYRNSLLAGRKGQNKVLWVIITIVLFYCCEMVGALFLVFFSYNGNIYNLTMQKNNHLVYNEAEVAKLSQFLLQPSNVLLVVALGFGGYLLTRYLLERKPDIKRSGNNNNEAGMQ